MSDTDTSGDPFCGSYYENAIGYGSGGSDVAAMFPPGWGSPGETPEGTIRENAIQGLWLPLYIPEGCPGANDSDLPEVVFYAANHVASSMDQEFGPAHSSPEVDEERFVHAAALALDAAKSPGGSPNVRPAT